MVQMRQIAHPRAGFCHNRRPIPPVAP